MSADAGAFGAYDFDGDARWAAYYARLDLSNVSAAELPKVVHRLRAKWYKKNVDADFDLATAGAAPAQAAARQRPAAAAAAAAAAAGAEEQRQEPAPAAKEEAPRAESASQQQEERTNPASEPTASSTAGSTSAFSAGIDAATKLAATAAEKLSSVAVSAQAALTKLPAATAAMDYARQMDRQQFFFSVNCMTLLSAAIYILGLVPFVGLKMLGYRSYYWALTTAAVAFGSSLYLQAGRPKQLTADGIKAWLPSVLSTNNFSYLWYCTVFLGSEPLLMALVPLCVCACYNAMTYAQKRLTHLPIWSSHGVRAAAFLQANTRQALQLNATVEVGLLLTITLQIFTFGLRRALTAFIYLQLLRMRYHCKDGNVYLYHRQMWQQVGGRVAPLLDGLYRYVPQAQGPLEQVQAWFRREG